MLVELRAEARKDLIEAAGFYESQRDGLGDEFIESLFADLESLEVHGGIHEVVYGLHRKLSHRFPFAIYYAVSKPVVDVIAILDCRRDPESTELRIKQTPFG